TPGPFPALPRRDWPSSETPCVANLEYFCSSDSWQGGRGYVAFTVAQINACIETCGRNTRSVTVCKVTLPAMTKSEKLKDPLRIFVLADTHDRLPETVSEIAPGADEIWHLGEVCMEPFIDELGAYGLRATGVRGNCDGNSEGPWFV